MTIKSGVAFKLAVATIVVVISMTVAWTLLLNNVEAALLGGAITLAYVVALGIPVFLILKTKNKLNGVNLAAMGFLCGWLPMAAISLSSAGKANFFWAQAQMLLFFGGLGLVSALAFGVVWNLLSVSQDKFRWQGKLG